MPIKPEPNFTPIKNFVLFISETMINRFAKEIKERNKQIKTYVSVREKERKNFYIDFYTETKSFPETIKIKDNFITRKSSRQHK